MKFLFGAKLNFLKLFSPVITLWFFFMLKLYLKRKPFGNMKYSEIWLNIFIRMWFLKTLQFSEWILSSFWRKKVTCFLSSTTSYFLQIHFLYLIFSWWRCFDWCHSFKSQWKICFTEVEALIRHCFFFLKLKQV